MSIATEVTYVDGTTAVTAAWLNNLQQHLAGWINLQVTAAGQVVTIGALPDDDAAVAYINGEQRINEVAISFTFGGGEATDTYDVFVVGDGGGPAFTMEVVSGAPAGTNTRKVAEVDYDTTLDVITDLRVLRGSFEAHDHDILSGAGQISHDDLVDSELGDDHSQYVRIDGTRAFTVTVEASEPTDPTHLATKKYADDQVSTGVPTGTIIPFGGSSAPSGWLLCDGASFTNATFPDLAAMLADVYGGDGGTNTDVPDLRGVFPFGKPVAGEGSSLADTGGALDHTHTQPTHTHAEVGHTHTVSNHTHTNPATASGGSHNHTQPSTGNSGNHAHSGTSHTHASGGYSHGSTGGSLTGGVHASQGSAGLYNADLLAVFSSGTSHSHGGGSYFVSAHSAFVTGTSASASFSHTHLGGNSGAHSHGGGGISGTSGAGGTANTSTNGAHTHSNATTGSGGSHTHTVGSSGGGLGATGANTPGTTTADGDEPYSSENPPFVAVHYIIKTD